MADQDFPIVYVVDDDADVRLGVIDCLESASLNCIAYASTTELLQSARPNEASCLILDVRLPGPSGLELQAQLNDAGMDVPIIFITGYGDIPMSAQAMKAGAVDFLTKPIRDQDLLDAVQAALERDRTRREREQATRDLRSRYDALSPRQREILKLVTSGLMNKQVAAELGISEVSVKVHRHNVMEKMGARSLAELVRMADALVRATATIKPKYT